MEAVAVLAVAVLGVVALAVAVAVAVWRWQVVAWVVVSGGMPGMGGMGRSSGTMPAVDGNDDARPNDYVFLRRSRELGQTKLMIGMIGMSGGMGGGMMGGMGGGMGGMGGGMRSVPPTGLPSSLLNPGQTRHLPTRLVILSPPDPRDGVSLPEKGEPLQSRRHRRCQLESAGSEGAPAAGHRRGFQANRAIGHVAFDRGTGLGYARGDCRRVGPIGTS